MEKLESKHMKKIDDLWVAALPPAPVGAIGRALLGPEHSARRWAEKTGHVILTTEEHEALVKAAKRNTSTQHENPFRAPLSRIDKTGNF